MFLGFDTETTGLPPKFKPLDHPEMPDIVQLCAKLFDLDRVYASINLIVLPTVPITEGSLKIHGISQELCEKVGVSRRVMVSMFQNLLKSADMIVCHNLKFDLERMLTAYSREGISTQLLMEKKKYCTMLESTSIVGIQTPKGPKWPTLQEAYIKLVDPKGFENAHDAEVDVNAMIPIFRALQNGSGCQNVTA